MKFSEAVEEFERLCQSSEKAGEFATFSVEYKRHTTPRIAFNVYFAFTGQATKEFPSLELAMAYVREILAPVKQGIAAALDAVDVEDLSRADDDGMPATGTGDSAAFHEAVRNDTAGPGGVPTPEQFDGSEGAVRPPDPPDPLDAAEQEAFDSADEDAAQAE